MSSIINQVRDVETNNVTFTGVVDGVLDVVFTIIAIIAVIVIIYGGVQYAMSSGEPGKVSKAKTVIFGGVIGLVISLLAFAIVEFVLYSLQQ